MTRMSMDMTRMSMDRHVTRSGWREARRSLLALGVAVAALAMGCQMEFPDGEEIPLDLEAEEGEVLGSLEQELRQTGNATFVGCSGDNLTVAQAAFNKMRDRIWTGNGAIQFHACLKEAIFTGSYAYPELLLSILKENIGTTIICGPAGSGNADPETITVGQFAFDVANAEFAARGIPKENTIADLMIHELAHTKGRLVLPLGTGHEGPEEVVNGTGDCVQGCIERQMSITTLVSSCLFDGRPMDWNFVQAPNLIPFRSLMGLVTGEAALSPVGVAIDMNAPAENHCLQSEVGVGLSGRSGALVDKLGMVCRTGTSEFVNTPTGGNGGVAFDSRCPANEVMIGIKGRAGMKLDQVGAICALSSSVAAGGSATNVNLPSFGGTTGNVFERRCPSRQVVKGMRIRHSGTVQRVELVCQKHDQLRSIITGGATRLGGTAGTRLADEHCPSMSAMDVFWGVADDATGALNRLGAGCTKVSNTSAGGLITEAIAGGDNSNHMLTFHGFQQPEGTGLGRTGGCGANSLMVGMTAWTSSNSVRAVRGICASNATQWSGGLSTSTFNSSQLGTPPAGSTQASFTCPFKSFLTGWRIAEDPNVMSITPRCRAF